MHTNWCLIANHMIIIRFRFFKKILYDQECVLSVMTFDKMQLRLVYVEGNQNIYDNYKLKRRIKTVYKKLDFEIWPQCEIDITAILEKESVLTSKAGRWYNGHIVSLCIKTGIDIILVADGLALAQNKSFFFIVERRKYYHKRITTSVRQWSSAVTLSFFLCFPPSLSSHTPSKRQITWHWRRHTTRRCR